MKKKSIVRVVLAFSLLLSFISVQPVWPQNTGYQTRPIELGTSGGNINDISQLYCCTGTLGALVQDGNRQYILSNNHVLARTNRGIPGEDIVQPGLADWACFQNASNSVANLSSFREILFSGTVNTVDAAIAGVRVGMVDSSGSILDIGRVSNQTVSATLNMPVKKSGRTTRLTRAKVSAINATILVTYNETCGMGSQTAIFTNQIRIKSSRFSKGGDSGSLIVEDCSPYPRAIGLLFAGGAADTFANPIGDVLSSFSVGVVGDDTHCTAPIKTKGGKGSGAQPHLSPHASQRAVEAVSKVKERHEETILTIDGVVGAGVGISETEPEEVLIEIYVKKPAKEMKHVIPEILEDIPVKIVETGEIVAF